MMGKLILAIVSLTVSCSLFAEIFMNKLFTDNMVLQNGEMVKVWGKAMPNANVQVSFAGQKVSTNADTDGKWLLYLKPLKINKNAQILSVFENGKLGKEIKGVLVGEVWFISGQSNMGFSIRGADNYKDELESADNYSQIRVFMHHPADHVEAVPQEDFTSPYAKWEVVSKKTLNGQSAVGYFFAKRLSDDMNKVPVGLIQSALGGASMITWIAREDLNNVKCQKKELENFDKNNANYNYKDALAKYEVDIKAYEQEKKLFENNDVNKGKEFKKNKPRKPHPKAFDRPARMPGYLYNANVAPATNYTIKGFLWYQGEDDGYNASIFQEKFESIINNWRKYWKNENLPFIFIQLPSWGDRWYKWGDVRQAQYNTAKNLSNVYMTVVIDLGEEKDIHPKNKLDVGMRAGGIALKEVYKKDVLAYGPKFENFKYDSDSVSMKVNPMGKKLVQKGTLRGFDVLCGKKWFEAKDIKLDAKTNVITVKSPNGEDIDGVRYLWKIWAAPDVCLFNEVALPAMPFIDKNEE